MTNPVTPLFIQPEPELDLGPAVAPLIPAAPFDEVSLECDVCQEVFTGTAKGRTSAGFKLGTHRWVKHGLKSDRKKARAGAAAVDPGDYVDRPVGTAAREIASSIGDNRRVPTANDLAKGFGKGLALATVAGAVYATETDPGIPDGAEGQQVRNYLVEYLSLKERAAQDIMTPIARMVAPTGLNKKYGRSVVDNIDVVASFSELGAMAMHWRTYLRARSQQVALMAGGQQPAPPPGNIPAGGLFAVPDLPPAPVNQYGGVIPGAPISPAPMSGVVLQGPSQ